MDSRKYHESESDKPIDTVILYAVKFYTRSDEFGRDFSYFSFSYKWQTRNTQLTPQDWEDLKFSSHNLLSNVDEILRHFNF